MLYLYLVRVSCTITVQCFYKKSMNTNTALLSDYIILTISSLHQTERLKSSRAPMEIPVGAQVFDLVFHPTVAMVYAGLLTGHVKAFAYDNGGNHEPVFAIRPSKRSCRGLSINEDGSQLYAVGKSKSLQCVLIFLDFFFTEHLISCTMQYH